MTTLSNKAIKTLIWFRDNEHCYGSWEPQSLFPDVTHMEIGGNGKTIEVPVEVMDELRGMLDYCVGEHMFYPKPYLLTFLKTRESLNGKLQTTPKISELRSRRRRKH